MSAEVCVREFTREQWTADSEPTVSLTGRWRALGNRQKLLLGAAALVVVLVNAATLWSYLVYG